MERVSERERGRDRERVIEIERGESKLEGEIPYVIVLVSPQKNLRFSPQFCIDTSKKEILYLFANRQKANN